ncbi:MAG: caspase family protein [Hyphomicrobium sp.]
MASAAERRVALVIGNAAYKDVSELTNPVNDATDVAEKLKKLSFDVFLGKDLNRSEMQEAFKKFASEVKPGDVGLFYYAGHGIQVAGENFLIPTDMPKEIKVKSESESVGSEQLEGYLINLSDVLGAFDKARVGFVFLDACRNTPNKEELGLQIIADDNMTRKVRALSFERGLSTLNTKSANKASGLFRAYATDKNQVTDDGTGRNSPFAKALLKHLDTPGLELHQMMRRVRADVKEETNGRQTPWEESALTEDYYFVPQSSNAKDAAPGAPKAPGVKSASLGDSSVPASTIEEQVAPGKVPEDAADDSGSGSAARPSHTRPEYSRPAYTRPDTDGPRKGSASKGSEPKAKAARPSSPPPSRAKSVNKPAKVVSRSSGGGGRRSGGGLPPGLGAGVGAGL